MVVTQIQSVIDPSAEMISIRQRLPYFRINSDTWRFLGLALTLGCTVFTGLNILAYNVTPTSFRYERKQSERWLPTVDVDYWPAT